MNPNQVLTLIQTKAVQYIVLTVCVVFVFVLVTKRLGIDKEDIKDASKTLRKVTDDE